MSADGGRVTPGIPVSFYEHAVRLQVRDPQLPLPGGGFPLLDDARDGSMSQLREYVSGREVLLALSRHASMLTDTLAHRSVLASLSRDVRRVPPFCSTGLRAPGERDRVENELLAAVGSEPPLEAESGEALRQLTERDPTSFALPAAGVSAGGRGTGVRRAVRAEE